MAAGEKTSAAVACSLMQHVPKHVGEQTYRADGGAIQGSLCVEANFLLRLLSFTNTPPTTRLAAVFCAVFWTPG
jgi:hypothetical protein